jgi:hypothetical protein
MELITLNNYLVKIYSNKSIDIGYMLDSLNNQKYPRGIVESLENVAGVFKIEVYDKESNELLLSSSIL